MGTEIEQLKQQLAASQAREVQLRTALGHILEYWNGDTIDVVMLDALEHIEDVAHEALATPQDAASIEEVIAKACEIMRARCDKVLEDMREEYGDEEVSAAWVLRAIHNMSGVTMGDVQK